MTDVFVVVVVVVFSSFLFGLRQQRPKADYRPAFRHCNGRSMMKRKAGMIRVD
jgi:hypothetical protein